MSAHSASFAIDVLPQTNVALNAFSPPDGYQLTGVIVEPTDRFRSIYVLVFANGLISEINVNFYDDYIQIADPARVQGNTQIQGIGLQLSMPFFRDFNPTPSQSPSRAWQQHSELTSNGLHLNYLPTFAMFSGFAGVPTTSRTFEMNITASFIEVRIVPAQTLLHTFGSLLACQSCSRSPLMLHENYFNGQD